MSEQMEQLDATLVVHPSISRDPRIERIPHNFPFNNLKEETLATLLLENSDVFDKFPKLRIVICHCGGHLRRIIDEGQVIDASQPSRGPDNVVGRIVDGQVAKWAKEICLMDQEHINTGKHDSKTIEQLREEISAKVGENVKVARFSVFRIGE